MVGCPIEHIAEADHKAAPGKLIIAPDLTAASKAPVAIPRGTTTKRTVQIEATPCRANVHADVHPVHVSGGGGSGAGGALRGRSAAVAAWLSPTARVAAAMNDEIFLMGKPPTVH